MTTNGSTIDSQNLTSQRVFSFDKFLYVSVLLIKKSKFYKLVIYVNKLNQILG